MMESEFKPKREFHNGLTRGEFEDAPPAELRREDFRFDLPPELIAQQPPARRGDSRLLVLDGASGALEDRRFTDLPDLLRPGDLLVFNDTRVIPARLHGRKSSGGRVELLVERLLDQHRAWVQVRASKPPKPGGVLVMDAGFSVTVLDRRDDLFEVRVESEQPLLALLERYGQIPLPPYIARPPSATDRERYQTVYARAPGAVAAPTAGLHFDRASLDRLDAAGVAKTFITLHVGAGTFKPVRAERLADHRMHAEHIEVGEEACEHIRAARARGGRVIAVGTTAVRALESVCDERGTPRPRRGETRIFIYPGYRFRCVDALVTNFHLPESTLLMLVAAFAGREAVMAAYRHAVERRYRFFSYGDAMWLTRRPPR